jgi:predicted transcriptional regulator
MAVWNIRIQIMVNSKAKKSKESAKTLQIRQKNKGNLYEAILCQERASNKHKVTISVSEPLIESLDIYAARTGTNRSAVIEEALFLWCQKQQEQVDISYYANLNEKDRQADQEWTQVTTEAAKHIWQK